MRKLFLGIAGATLVVVAAPDIRLGSTNDVGHARGLQGGGALAAAAAAKASPALVEALGKEIGASPEQAAGAAGALFGLAKSRLKPEEFSQVATAVPGMDALL